MEIFDPSFCRDNYRRRFLAKFMIFDLKICKILRSKQNHGVKIMDQVDLIGFKCFADLKNYLKIQTFYVSHWDLHEFMVKNAVLIFGFFRCDPVLNPRLEVPTVSHHVAHAFVHILVPLLWDWRVMQDRANREMENWPRSWWRKSLINLAIQAKSHFLHSKVLKTANRAVKQMWKRILNMQSCFFRGL